MFLKEFRDLRRKADQRLGLPDLLNYGFAEDNYTIVTKDGARLVAGRKQNPPGGPRISAPPPRVPTDQRLVGLIMMRSDICRSFSIYFVICRSFSIYFTANNRHRAGEIAHTTFRSPLNAGTP